MKNKNNLENNYTIKYIKNTFYLVTFIAFFVSILVSWIPSKTTDKPINDSTQIHPSQASYSQPHITGKTAEINSNQVQEFAIYLKELFGPYLDKPLARLKLLDKLIAFYSKLDLQKTGNLEFQEDIESFIRLFFPEFSEQLLIDLDNLLSYQSWLKSTQSELSRLPLEVRQDYIWQMREEYFGEAAYSIWQTQWQTQQLQQSLELLNQSGFSIDQKLEYYSQSISESFPQNHISFIKENSLELVNRFLSLASVQYDLKKLEPEARQSILSNLRHKLGMDQKAINRWTKLDEKRHIRRQIGNEYMLERQALSQIYQGDKLNEEISKLRQQMFMQEAEIIKSEEDVGYFRFEEPQVIGIN